MISKKMSTYYKTCSQIFEYELFVSNLVSKCGLQFHITLQSFSFLILLFDTIYNERKVLLGKYFDMGDGTVGTTIWIHKLYGERKERFVRAQEIHNLDH